MLDLKHTSVISKVDKINGFLFRFDIIIRNFEFDMLLVD